MHLTPTRYVRALAGPLFLIWSLTLAFVPTAAAQTVVQHGWEDGTLQGWAPFGGGVVLTNSAAVANSGSRSLLTSGRTAGFNGPSLEVGTLLTPGTIYQFTAFVRLAAGESATQVTHDDAEDAVGRQRGVRAGGLQHGGHRCRLGGGAGRLIVLSAVSPRCSSMSRAPARRRPTTWTTSASVSCPPPAAATRRTLGHAFQLRDRHP